MGGLRPVDFFPSKLDTVAAWQPKCIRAVAAAKKEVLASRDLVCFQHLTLLIPHAVYIIQKTAHLSAAQWLRYNAVLLEMPNITVKRCTVLNTTTLLPRADDSEPHDCVASITAISPLGQTSKIQHSPMLSLNCL